MSPRNLWVCSYQTEVLTVIEFTIHGLPYFFRCTEDLATDWVNNKLYFTDSVHARIEVIDLDQPDQRVELLRTGGNTLPRSIAVDPRSRYICSFILYYF